LNNIYFLGPYSSSFDATAFNNIAPTNSVFIDTLYASGFSTYNADFNAPIDFTLIDSIQYTPPEPTFTNISFPPILPETVNKIVTFTIYDENNILYDTFSGINITNYTFENLNPSTSYTFTMNISLNPIIQTVILSFTTASVPISNICFAKNTLIMTDQGYIPVQELLSEKHTIRRQKIKAITQSIMKNTKEKEDYLVLFKPHAFGKNKPFKSTLLSPEHEIFYKKKNKRISAQDILREEISNDKICKIRYNGDILYNILLENHSLVNANNLICETLNPKNIIAKLYQGKESYSYKKKIIDSMNSFILRGDVDSYKNIMSRI
jgi:hypothetical protein